MARHDYQSLRFGWARELKELAARGDTERHGQIVDHIRAHVDEIGVFEQRWRGIISGALSRGLEFEITADYALDLLRKQGGLCALSGLPIGFGSSGEYRPGRKVTGTASLDRINSVLGYIPGNVWWLHRDVNKMKQDLPNDVFVELCCRVAKATRGGEDIPEPPNVRMRGNPEPSAQRVARFVAECCEPSPRTSTRASDLWGAFEAWRLAANLPAVGQKWFSAGLSRLGYERHKSNVVYYHGLRLKPREGCEGFSDPRTTLAAENSEQSE